MEKSTNGLWMSGLTRGRRRTGGLCALVFSLAILPGCSASKQSYLAKGNKFFAAGKYDEAALNYRAAIQKDAAFGEAYYRLGLTAIKLTRFAKPTALCFVRFNCYPETPELRPSSRMYALASTSRTPAIRKFFTRKSEICRAVSFQEPTIL